MNLNGLNQWIQQVRRHRSSTVPAHFLPSGLTIERIHEFFRFLLRPAQKPQPEKLSDDFFAVVEAIRDQPTFSTWLLQLEKLPLPHRIPELMKMAFLLREEDRQSEIANALDRIQDPALFHALCLFLHDDADSD